MATGANPVLRHYSAVSNAAANTVDPLVTVGANRALVISKIKVVQNSNAAQTFNIRIGGAGKSITGTLTLNPGEEWTETGLIALAGETIDHQSNSNSGIITHIFGEEVDN